MNSLNRRRFLLALASAAGLAAGLPAANRPLLAQTFDEQIEKRKAELDELNRRRSEAQAFLAATQARRSALQSRLRVIEEARYREITKLQELQKNLETRELDIYETTRQIQALSGDFGTQKQVLGGKLRALYKARRGVSALELVLSSSSFTEALDRIASLQLVVQQDFAGIRTLAEKQQEIGIRTRNLESQRDEVERLKAQREQIKRELEARSREQQEIIDRVKAEEGAIQGDISAFRREQEVISQRIADLRYQKRLEIERLERQRQLEEARRRAASAGGGGNYIWPLGGLITTEYGGCTFGQCPHTGIDIAAPLATPIVAARDGVVLYAGYAVPGDRRGSYGMIVIIAHSATDETLYAHLADITLPPPVASGQLVARGQVIGYVGLTGWTTGPHLHFEYRVNGQPLNPRRVLG